MKENTNKQEEKRITLDLWLSIANIFIVAFAAYTNNFVKAILLVLVLNGAYLSIKVWWDIIKDVLKR